MTMSQTVHVSAVGNATATAPMSAHARCSRYLQLHAMLTLIHVQQGDRECSGGSSPDALRLAGQVRLACLEHQVLHG